MTAPVRQRQPLPAFTPVQPATVQKAQQPAAPVVSTPAVATPQAPLPDTQWQRFGVTQRGEVPTQEKAGAPRKLGNSAQFVAKSGGPVGQAVSSGAGAITNEPTVPPPGRTPYTPDPTADADGDGVSDASRVGVPAMSVPPPPGIGLLPNLTADERRVEVRFAAAFEAHPEGMTREYLDKLKAGEIGDAPNVFSTDDAKLLSPDYNPQNVDEQSVKDARSRYTAVVHGTANAVAKRAFVTYLDEVVAKLPPEQRTVLVTCGGVAAGKGYALGKVKEVADIASKVGAVWDSAGEQNGTENPWVLKECQKRGIKPVFVYVDANPTETWANPQRGVIERAQKKGRMVDARLFADSYVQGARNFDAFMKTYKGQAEFIVLENRGTPRRLGEVPRESLALDGEKLYADAAQAIQARPDLPPAIQRGATIGQRVWGAPTGG